MKLKCFILYRNPLYRPNNKVLSPWILRIITKRIPLNHLSLILSVRKLLHALWPCNLCCKAIALFFNPSGVLAAYGVKELMIECFGSCLCGLRYGGYKSPYLMSHYFIRGRPMFVQNSTRLAFHYHHFLVTARWMSIIQLNHFSLKYQQQYLHLKRSGIKEYLKAVDTIGNYSK